MPLAAPERIIDDSKATSSYAVDSTAIPASHQAGDGSDVA